MLGYVGIGYVTEDGEVECIGQKQVVQVVRDAEQNVQRQICSAVEGQVNIGACFMCRFGAGTV